MVQQKIQPAVTRDPEREKAAAPRTTAEIREAHIDQCMGIVQNGRRDFLALKLAAGGLKPATQEWAAARMASITNKLS